MAVGSEFSTAIASAAAATAAASIVKPGCVATQKAVNGYEYSESIWVLRWLASLLSLTCCVHRILQIVVSHGLREFGLVHLLKRAALRSKGRLGDRILCQHQVVI